MKVAVVYFSQTGNTKKMADLIAEGARKACKGVDVKVMSVEEVDEGFLAESSAVIVGGPTYEAGLAWQAKRFLDEVKVDMAGKLGGAFASQNWPGGGGADLAELQILAAMLVRGMLVFSGGIEAGEPLIHFGAVSTRAPEGLSVDRCLKLGDNIATKAMELFQGECPIE